ALTPRQHEVRIVDENVEALDFDTDCDVVGISFMTALAPRAYEIAAHFRRRGRIVVGGGYHATLCPEDAAPHFDALVVGDAEGAWERLLADLQRGELQKVYRQADCVESVSLALNRPLTPAPSPSDGERVAEGRVRGLRGILSPGTPPESLRTPVPRRDLIQRTARHYATINAVQAG